MKRQTLGFLARDVHESRLGCSSKRDPWGIAAL